MFVYGGFESRQQQVFAVQLALFLDGIASHAQQFPEILGNIVWMNCFVVSAHCPPPISFSSFAIDWRMAARSPSSFQLNRMRRMLPPS